jgi:two-component system phosphate regulon response regulator PhoB
MATEALILIVEDDDGVAEMLGYNLEKAGFETERAPDGEEALLLVQERVPDLILLDWMIPKISGIEICRRVRQSPALRHIPIIMLTARAEESDRVRGLDTGADDYVSKPFSIIELLARVRALLRRARPELGEDVLRHGDLELDRITHRVLREGSEIHLGPTEYRLLEHFLQKPGRVFSREQLLDAVWGTESEVEIRTVDVHVGRLRKALRQNGGDDPIRTVRAAGYALRLN